MGGGSSSPSAAAAAAAAAAAEAEAEAAAATAFRDVSWKYCMVGMILRHVLYCRLLVLFQPDSWYGTIAV